MPKIYNVIIFISIIVLAIIIFVREKEFEQLEFEFNDFKVDILEDIKDMKYDIIDIKGKLSASPDKVEGS